MIFGGRGVVSTALLMVVWTSSVHLRCALGQMDDVCAVPREQPGSGSSCESTGMGVPPMRTWARRVCSAVLRSFLFLCSVVCEGSL